MNDKVLDRGNRSMPKTIDPHKVFIDYERYIAADCFEGLVSEDLNGNPTPGLCTHWEVSQDKTKYRFYLRKNLKWSNGNPITADDVIFSFRRAIQVAKTQKASYFEYLSPIKNAENLYNGQAEASELGVRVLEDGVIEIELEKPILYFIEGLMHPIAFTVPKNIIEKHQNEWTHVDNIVTNGAYKCFEVADKKYVGLKKNNHYWNANNVSIEEIKYHSKPDGVNDVDRFIANEIDVVEGYGGKKVDWVHKNIQGNIVKAQIYVTLYYVFNTSKPPFDNLEYRKALSLLVDRMKVHSALNNSVYSPLHSFTPPGLRDYKNQHNEHYHLGMKEKIPLAQNYFRMATNTHRPSNQEMKAIHNILENSGNDSPEMIEKKIQNAVKEDKHKIFGFELAQYQGNLTETFATSLKNQWEENLPVKVKLKYRKTNDHYYSAMIGGDFQLGFAGYPSANPDALRFLTLFESKHKHNFGRFKDPEFDALIEKARASLDVKQRGQLLQQAESLLLNKHYALIPLSTYEDVYLVQKNIENFRVNPNGICPSKYMKFTKNQE